MSSAHRAGITSFTKRAVQSTALIGASLAALGARPALAEEATVASNVAMITVTGHKDGVASPKYTAPLLDTPQTVTVVDQQLIEEQKLEGLQEILATLPGITFGAGEGGGGYGDKVTLRGYDASNDILVDGVRDSAQYSRTDSFNLAEVSVVNGADSVYSGVGSVGGTINLVTKRPVALTQVGVTLSGGTDDYARFTADINRQITPSIAVRLNVMAHQNHVPGRDVEKYKRWGVAPGITFGMGTDTQLTLLYTHQEDNNIPVYGVPYALNAYNDGPLPGVDRSDYFGYRNVDKQKINADIATVIFDHRFSDTLSVRSLTRWERIHQLSIVDPPQGSYCLVSGIDPYTGASCSSPGTYTPGGPRGNLRDTVNDEIVNETDLRAHFTTLGVEHTVVLGASASHETYRLDTGRVFNNPLGATPDPVLPVMNLSNPDSYYTGPYNYIRRSLTDSEVTNLAVYLFDNLDLTKRWQINGGVRFESNRAQSTTGSYAIPYPTPPASPAVTQSPMADNNNDLLSYRVGLVFKPVPQASFYLAYGNSKTPAQASVNRGCNLVASRRSGPNCNVDPQTAVNYEIGAKWNALKGRLQLTAALFRNELTNFLVNSGDPTVPDQQLDGKSRVDGVALGASGSITDHWSLFANYTHLKSELLQSISDFSLQGGTLDYRAGDPLPNTPENSFSLWTTYELPYSITIGYGATYEGETAFNRAAAGAKFYYAPDYWVQRAMIAYDWDDRATLQLNVDNLFDETYYTHIRNNATSGWAIPGPSRSAVVSLSYRF